MERHSLPINIPTAIPSLTVIRITETRIGMYGKRKLPRVVDASELTATGDQIGDWPAERIPPDRVMAAH